MELGFERAQDSIDKLKAAGIFISLGDAKARRADPSAPVHTMHIAQAAAAVSGKTAGEIYERYLAPGRIAHSIIGRPTPEEAADCIHASGGIASIDDVKALMKQGLYGAICGKSLYTGTLGLGEAVRVGGEQNVG